MIVIKFGGSLIKNSGTIKKIFKEIEKINDDFLIVPGGGEFADLVLKYYETHKLNLKISHDACILAMDIVGMIISNFTKIEASYELRKNIIFLPSQFLFKSELEISNKTTSDSISVFIAEKINANFIILLKSVDGIKYNGKILKEIKADDLKKIKTKVVDENFPEFIKKYNKQAFIINGKFPERINSVKDLIENRNEKVIKETILTKVYP